VKSRAERVRDAPEVSSWHTPCHAPRIGAEGGQPHFCHLEVPQDGGHPQGRGSLPPGIPGEKEKPWRSGSVALSLALFIRLKCDCSLWNAAGAGWLGLCLTRFCCAVRTSPSPGSLSQCGDEARNSMAEHPLQREGWASLRWMAMGFPASLLHSI